MTFISTFRDRTSLQEGALLLGVLSLLGLQMENFAGDPGVGWHLATGEWIANNGAVPKIDPFLAAAAPRPWVSDQWLSDYLLSQLYHLGSWPLLYAVLTALYLGIYFLVLQSGLRQLGVGCLAAIAGTLVAFKAGQIHFILRPVMASFLFFALVYVWVMSAEKQKALPTRMAWCGLPGLFLLWANLHPGFVLGLFLLGALSLWSFLSSPKEPGRWGAFLAIFLLCATTTLINPQGFELHRSILALQQSSYFMQLHEEWRPVSFGSPEGELFLSALSVIVLGVVLGRGERRVGGVLAFCFVLFFAWASLRAVRMVPFFGIVAAYPIACALLSLGRTAPFLKFSSFRRLAQAFQFFEDREMSARRCGALWILLSAALVGMSLVSGHLGLFHGPFGPPATRYPYGAIEALLQSRAQRGETSPWVVAAASEWGGFITFQGQRLLRPLLDDRNTLIGERYYQDFEEHIGKGRGWEEFLDSQNADAVLLLPHMPLIKAFKDAPRPGWELLYQDSLASVLVRKQGQDID